MHIVLDGIIFQKSPHGGIARLYREVLPRLCQLDSALHITLFLDGPVESSLPEHEHIVVRRAPAVRRKLPVGGALARLLFPLRRALGRAWNAQRGRWLDDLNESMWWSTYYTLPPTGWRGPQVVFLHDMTHERFPEIFASPQDEAGRRQKADCLRAARLILCNSNATRSDGVSFFPQLAERMVVTPLAHSPFFRPLQPDELAAAAPPLLNDLTAPLVLFVGSRAHYKNFLMLFSALVEWPESENPPHLLALGPEWSKEEQSMLRFSPARARFHNIIDPDDATLRYWYNRATVFIYPSLAEGFGIPLLEALACGCPSVVSDLPVFHEVAGDAALYFDPEDPTSIRSALRQSLSEGRPSPRTAAGLVRAQAYSWDATARAIYDHISHAAF